MSTNLNDAILTYHDLLTNRIARVTHEHLVEQQLRRGLTFGDRQLCTVLRPRFLTSIQYRFLQDRVSKLMSAFDKAYRRAVIDKPFRDQFGLHEWEEVLFKYETGIRHPSPLARLDAFFITDTNTLLFTEYNAEVPAAPAYNEELTAAFAGTPVMRMFSRHYEMQPLTTRIHTLHALLDTYYRWPYRNEPPRIAILDWKEVPTYSEFVLFERFFHEHGLPCKIVDPREVEYRNGKLMAGDYHITLIYKRVLIDELIERMGMTSPVVRAVTENKVCMVNPFRCKLLYKKASFAVLGDERNKNFFSAEEQAVISAHIPWTRRVLHRRTIHNDQPVDLIPYIVKYKDQFVLKPNEDYGGRGIVLGWEVDSATWEDSVKTALVTPYVVQERIVLPQEPYPSYIDGRMQLKDRQLDTAPFVFYGKFMDGVLTRLSTEALLNVTAGGGSTVPTMVITKR